MTLIAPHSRSPHLRSDNEKAPYLSEPCSERKCNDQEQPSNRSEIQFREVELHESS